jgi:hypothetical protein
VGDMLERCKSGPPAARVTEVAVTEPATHEDLPAGFRFRPTSD